MTLNAYDGYDYRKKIAKKLYGATYGNVVSVLSVHYQASVTVAEVEDARRDRTGIIRLATCVETLAPNVLRTSS
nr:MAG TPA: hypothetical protein [Caudoviricetes sp.]